MRTTSLALVHRIVARRIRLCKSPPNCVACGDRQVQLVEAHRVPAKWKCRMCKKVFEFEPSTTTNAKETK